MSKRPNAITVSLEREIVDILIQNGLFQSGAYQDPSGDNRLVFKRNCDGGESTFSFGVFVSVNKTLFVRAAVGINSAELWALLKRAIPGIANVIAAPYALLGWGISDIGTTRFDPSPSCPGTEFCVSSPLKDSEIVHLSELIPSWLSDSESYLTKLPIYDFYRFDCRIDKTVERWREMVALLKLLRGERYVAYQLLLDLIAEADGRRPEEGDEMVRKLHGLRKNKKELVFQEELFKGISVADGQGDSRNGSCFSDLQQVIDDRIRERR